MNAASPVAVYDANTNTVHVVNDLSTVWGTSAVWGTSTVRGPQQYGERRSGIRAPNQRSGVHPRCGRFDSLGHKNRRGLLDCLGHVHSVGNLHGLGTPRPFGVHPWLQRRWPVAIPHRRRNTTRKTNSSFDQSIPKHRAVWFYSSGSLLLEARAGNAGGARPKIPGLPQAAKLSARA